MYKEVNNSRPVHSCNCTVYCRLYFTKNAASRTNKPPCMQKYSSTITYKPFHPSLPPPSLLPSKAPWLSEVLFPCVVVPMLGYWRQLVILSSYYCERWVRHSSRNPLLSVSFLLLLIDTDIVGREHFRLGPMGITWAFRHWSSIWRCMHNDLHPVLHLFFGKFCSLMVLFKDDNQRKFMQSELSNWIASWMRLVRK